MKTIGKADIQNLADEFGTPLYVYDRGRIEENYNKLKSAFTKYYENTSIHYSVNFTIMY